MKSFSRSFRHNSRKCVPGQGLVEYALILFLVAVVVIGALTLLGPQVGGVFSSVSGGMGSTGGCSIPATYGSSTTNGFHRIPACDPVNCTTGSQTDFYVFYQNGNKHHTLCVTSGSNPGGTAI